MTTQTKLFGPKKKRSIVNVFTHIKNVMQCPVSSEAAHSKHLIFVDCTSTIAASLVVNRIPNIHRFVVLP